MDNYVDFRKFVSNELALECGKILDENKIPFEIDDSELRFKLVYPNISTFQKVIVRIPQEDLERANMLIINENENCDVNHYLFTFSDKDIIDVIANPSDWTEEEQSIAKQIISQRSLTITANDIIIARRNKLEVEKKEIKTRPVIKSYNWFLTIALLSILNSILIANNSTIRFIFGLAFTQALDQAFYLKLARFEWVSIITSTIFSSVFILFWYFSRANKNWAYIAGLILYGFDSLIFIDSKYWVGVGFHVLALIFILNGFLKNRAEKKSLNTLNTTEYNN